MRFAYRGKIFDTENSIRIGQARYDGLDDFEKIVETLYQTRNGAFFIFTVRNSRALDELGDLKTEIERSVYPLDGDQVLRWKTENEIEIFEKQFFTDLPEAAAEGEAGRGKRKKKVA
jgi:hypothetical protein